MTDSEPLGTRLSSEPSDLLPAHRLAAGEVPPDSLEVRASVSLGSGVWLSLLQGEQLLAAPLVEGPRGLRRARPGDGASAALLDRLRAGRGIDGFTIVTAPGEPGHSLEMLVATGDDERAMAVDQTHESVVVADRVVVKWAVRAEPSPAPTVVTHLAEAGFQQMPRPVAFVLWPEVDDSPVVASVMAYLGEAQNGWTWAVGDVRAGVEAGDLSDALGPMAEIGGAVADLHVAMATPTSVLPAPQSVAGSADLQAWRRLADRLLEEAIGVGGAEAAAFDRRRGQIVDALGALEDVGPTPMIPVHGDLHVGQVLRWTGGYAIADFDGNPVLPVQRRLDPQPAARDVAGMLQSIDHVGRVVRRRVEGADPNEVEAWIGAAQESFLSAYRSRLAAAGASELLDDRLLMPFRVEQECRELIYAGRHDERWRYVPHWAIEAMFP